MSTSTLQLLPTTATEIAQLDPATLASIPGVAYDLKRLKVYSSCLRCRAKKVKCDRKEPCSRCVKHSVECSYRELASVQLDIRQFQRHLNNPKIRKDGAGIITSTATPIITLPSGDTAVLSPATTAAATLIAAAKAGAAASLAAGSSGSGSNKKNSAEKKAASAAAKSSASSPSSSTPVSPTTATAATPLHSHPGSPASSGSSTDTESDTPMSAPASAKSIAMARAKVHKIIRRKPVVHKPTVAPTERFESTQVQRHLHLNSQLVAHVIEADDDEEEDEDAEEDNDMDDDDEDEDEIERVVLRSNPGSGPTFSHVATPQQQQADANMSSETEDEDQPQSRRRRNNEDVPIWRAKAVGKHKQTVHEQDLAETFGLAAYLQAKESSMDAGVPGQTIDYDMELERALAQRLPTSFSRPDRSLSRARKYAQAGYNPSLPYARPSHCQLAGAAGNGAHAPVAANCCCQIAAKQGQAPGTCFFSEKDGRSFIREEDSSMSPPPAQVVGYEQGETGRIAYSPSYQPSYNAKNTASGTAAAGPVSPVSAQKMEWSSSSSSNSSMLPPALALTSLKKFDSSSSSSSPVSSPRIELPPIYLPKLPFHQTTPASSDLSAFQVGRSSTNKGTNGNSSSSGDSRAPLEIACKFNEPNVDAWDMIEKPLSRTVPITTKRGRSVKMEMNWILS
ncbi:hypothetical protein BG015_002818 [Linnemannia schmuckeri]|uniref:Zn(2)-C6 fungal-type domain-containing protein n=1 Tax=Linnemannia schmuckeri TaxID=64567 RepID=A0A9P5RRI6_9FUNG|nr:hypothetical protein BG015_002818 [Linnemannia schmuckeri]